MFQLPYANYAKFENGKLKAVVFRIAFSFGRAEKIAKNPTMCFVRCRRRIAIQCRFYVHPLLDIPRLAKLREKRLRPSEQKRQEGWKWRLHERRGRRWDWNCKYPSSPSLRSLQSHRSISPLLYRPSALTPERVRGTYRRACFKESSLDDKSSDFPGFKFVTTKPRECVIRLSYRYPWRITFLRPIFIVVNQITLISI